jgi:hypothetical protein
MPSLMSQIEPARKIKLFATFSAAPGLSMGQMKHPHDKKVEWY